MKTQISLLLTLATLTATPNSVNASAKSKISDAQPAQNPAPLKSVSFEDQVALKEGKFSVPALPYDAGALSPAIDRETMNLHHVKHHQAYVDKLNEAMAKSPYAGKSLEALFATAQKLSPAIRNNAGGHWNHSLFWRMLTPPLREGERKPSGRLEAALNQRFNNLNQFKTEFDQAAKDRFGSGWAWLIVDKKGDLQITSTANQDNPKMAGIGGVMGNPVLALDVWEHAYYLKYRNRRPEYVTAFWSVVNWDEVARLYDLAKPASKIAQTKE